VNPNDLPASIAPAGVESDAISPLLRGDARSTETIAAAHTQPAVVGVVVGELIALVDDGRTPLVLFGNGSHGSGVPARATIDLHRAHIGQRVVVMFEQGDPARPIVLGLLRGSAAWPAEDMPAQVEVDADGQRMVLSAKEQLVLRCGKASITLTKAGKVLIEGSYLLSRSTGVNRVKGGSVQLN
jgi:hypothetical protein